MALETLREIALGFSKVQQKKLDFMTEETPFLDLLPFAQSTHDMWHNAEQQESADAIGFVEMDAPLPNVTSRSKLVRFDLGKMGAKITVHEDRARQYGGTAKYFADKEGPILKQTFMKIERTLIYDNLRLYAIKNYDSSTKKNIYSAGGTGNTNYSIVAVRFEEGVCQGLYNPKGFGKGAMFDKVPINGGNLYEIDDEKRLGYGVRLKSDIGFMITGTRNTAAIVNIDLTPNDADKTKPAAVPTATMIDDMLADIRSTTSGRTMLVMHPRVKGMLVREFKDKGVQFRPKDKVIDRDLDSWGGVPFVLSHNMDDKKEAKVPLS